MGNRYNKKYFTDEERIQAKKLKSRIYVKKYKERYPERVRLAKKKCPSFNKDKYWRNKIIERDGNCCANCGSRENLTLEHIIPKCIGGEYSYANLKILCSKCNSKTYHDLVKKALKYYFRLN
jgi:5-methylcytosine-specific restriction endonuclease McrA